MNTTEFVDKKGYNQVLDEVLEKIDQLSQNEKFLYQNKFLTSKILTTYRNCLEQLNIKNKTIENIILEYCYKSELNGAFSSDIFFDCLLICFREKIQKSCIDETNKKLKEFKSIYNKDDLNKIVIESLNNKLISSMVLEALDLAGVDGKIIPSKSPGENYSIELLLGYIFQLPPYMEFISNEQWNQHNVRVLIVDGVIERESEVHNILSENVKEKSPLLIVARGFGEEVIATLSANRTRGTLNVVPVRVPYETECINIPTDIAAACGGFIVTPFKGDVLSTKKLSELPIIHQIVVTRTGIQIINPDNVEQVKAHINGLVAKKNESNEKDLVDLIDKRISCFSARSVNIKLGKGIDREKMIELESIDYALRVHRDAFQNGIISFEDFKLISDIKIKDFKLKPLKSLYSGVNYAFNCYNLLNSVGGMLLNNSFPT